MISEDEYLERIVAGIQSVTTSGSNAEVIWNDKIEGRQFDVVVRFKLGLMSFLVLIEVKNRSRRVEAKDIEAFVTKASDQHGNKTIFVTTAGYQEGAILVAKRHGIDLFTVTFDDSAIRLPETATFLSLAKAGHEGIESTLSLGEKGLVTRIVGAKLLYTDGSVGEMPSDASQMQYYMAKTKLGDGRTLDAVVRTGDLPHPAQGESVIHHITIFPFQILTPPDEHFFSSGKIRGVECTLKSDFARPMQGNVMIDPGFFTAPVVYTNAITGEARAFPIHMLPLGTKQVKQRHYYFLDHPLRYFYCFEVKGETVTWRLIESFQNGMFIRVSFTQHVKYSHFYIPVKDRKIIKRLEARVKEFDALSKRDKAKKAG